MFFADTLTLDAPRRTAEGYYAVRARAARAGVQDYLGYEVDPEAKHFAANDVVPVYRPADEVFDPTSLHSFLMKPITDEHPKQAVTSANWKDLAGGVVAKAIRDGDHVAFDLIMMDAALTATVDSGKRGLSNGYACDLSFEDGTAPDGTPYKAVQRSIRGNHVAVVRTGRAGPDARISDSTAFCDALPAHLATFHDATENPVMKTMLIDGLTVDIANADTAMATITTILAARDAALGKVTGLEAKAVSDAATVVAKDAEIVKLTADLAAAKPTLQQLRDAGKAFAVIEAKAKASGVTVTDAMDEAAIMKAVVDKAMPGNTYAADHVAIAFEALTKDVKVGDAPKTISGLPAHVGDAAAQMQTAWKSEDHNAWRSAGKAA